MESLTFRYFSVLFDIVRLLVIAGVLVSVLVDIQDRAFESKSRGLTSMLKVNQQLVGQSK